MTRLRALFLSPAALLMLGDVLGAVVIVGAYSLLTRGAYGGVEHPWTLENYVRLFDPLYGDIFLRSLWIAAVATALCACSDFRSRCLSRGRARARISISGW